jgi:hypothetical protein
MKVYIVACMLIASGCTTVQDRVMSQAEKYGLGGSLVQFREAEGKAAGMISTKGKKVRRYAVNKYGERHTDGVFIRTVMDEEVVPPEQDDGEAIPVPEPTVGDKLTDPAVEDSPESLAEGIGSQQ